MAGSVDKVLRHIVEATPADEDAADSITLCTLLAVASLRRMPRPVSSSTMADLLETAEKIWCLLTDWSKTQRFKSGMQTARRSYRGIAEDARLQSDLMVLLEPLVTAGALDSVADAVNNRVDLQLSRGMLA